MEINLSHRKISGKTGLLLVGLLAGCSFSAYQLNSEQLPQLQQAEFDSASVQQGDLDLYIDAYGQLTSAQERLVTAPAAGTVTELLVRPGTRVEPDTLLLRLSNPKLKQELNQARDRLAQEQAKFAAFQYEQQNALLSYQTQLADHQAQAEAAELELKVNNQLIARGGAARIELQRAQLKLKQQNQRLLLMQERYKQFSEMQHYQHKQQQLVLKQQKEKLAMLEQQYADMAIKAGLAGSLQRMQVKLGQQVAAGASLACVGSVQQLVASLKLPQSQADQVDIDAPVLIDTQKGLLHARISRIESLVDNGFVLAEARLTDALTSNARPALPITSKVFIKTLPDSLFIQQLPGMSANRKQTVLVQTQTDLASARTIQTGPLTQGKIAIIAGLSRGEQVIQPHNQAFADAEQIRLVE